MRAVIQYNSETEQLTLSDVRRFVDICQDQGIPDDALVFGKKKGWLNRLVRLSASDNKRLGESDE